MEEAQVTKKDPHHKSTKGSSRNQPGGPNTVLFGIHDDHILSTLARSPKMPAPDSAGSTAKSSWLGPRRPTSRCLRSDAFGAPTEDQLVHRCWTPRSFGAARVGPSLLGFPLSNQGRSCPPLGSVHSTRLDPPKAARSHGRTSTWLQESSCSASRLRRLPDAHLESLKKSKELSPRSDSIEVTSLEPPKPKPQIAKRRGWHPSPAWSCNMYMHVYACIKPCHMSPMGC